MSEQKTAVITGATSGIGLHTAKELANKGYEVIILARNSQKSQEAYAQIKAQSPQQSVKLYTVDLSSIKQIKEVLDLIKKDHYKIDLLINNAGLIKRSCELSSDGIEMTFAVNYIAPFVIINELIAHLHQSDAPRVINLSSELYKNGKAEFDNLKCQNKFKGTQLYANSKMLITILTHELARRYNKVSFYALHPGVIATDVFREYPDYMNLMLGWFITKPEKGAQTLISLVTQKIDAPNGSYFNKFTPKPTLKIAQDKQTAIALWTLTDELIKKIS
jgi:short-subunit dehydrogenase